MRKKEILITGSSGFVGRHLLNRLAVEEGFKVFLTDKDFTRFFPTSPKSLDWLIHLASSHREAEEKLVYEKNELINKKVIKLIAEAGLTPNILFTSSIHEVGDSYYGRSKKEGSNYLQSVCNSWGTQYEKIVFPNLFGPYAKPYHTSVVANFCKDIISEKESYINNVEINLMYVQEAIRAILNFKSRQCFETNKIYLPELHRILKRLHLVYTKDPLSLDINSKFEAQLLSTLISYY